MDSCPAAEGVAARLPKEVAALKEELIERDILLSSVSDKLNQANAELEKQKIWTETQAQNHAEETSR